jgi:hypothetical protein
MALKLLETSHHRLPQSHFLRHPETDFEFSGPFAYLTHHSRDFVQIGFLKEQKEENAFEWHLDVMKHRFIDITLVEF